MSDDKAIRAAKLTLGAMLDKRRAKEAKDRAGGQIAPSKYLPDVPRQAHASGGYVPAATLPVPRRLAVAAPLQPASAQPSALEALAGLAGTASKVGDAASSLFGEKGADQHHPNDGHDHGPATAPSADHGGMSEAALAAWSGLTDAWGQPLTVTSAYRDPKRNEAVGGANNSQHMHGNAYDVDTSHLSYDERLALADAAWNAGFRGIGFYDNSMHFDVADPRAWGPSYSRDSIPEWALPWATQRYGYADGGEVTDLGQVREQKQLQGFHKGMMGDIHTRMTNAMDAHEKAVSAGIFDGYEVGDVLKGSAHPMRITGRYVQKWKPTPMAMRSFERMGTKPTIVEHEGEQYIPMLRYQTGVEGEDGFQEGTAYLDGVKAAGYQKMGGLRAVKADGGSVAERSPMFEGMSEHLLDDEGKPMDLWHGTPHQFDAFDSSKVGENTDMGFYGRGHYLTPDQDLAGEYAGPEDEGHVMGPLHAALKNPFIWDMSNEDRAYRTKKDLETMGIRREGKMDPWDNLRSHEIDTFMQHMQKRGHDGVIVKQPNWQDGEGANVTEIVVFNPNMIKHRDAEVGDPNDPRIMRADGGRIAASEWFTGSKIVHPDGRPKMVYHGTKRDFDAFGKKGVRSRFGPVQAALGHFLTDNPKLASAFATGKGGNVIPAYVSMRNPKVIPPDENGFSLTSRIEQDWTPEQAREFRRQAEADGHDGFIFQERSNLNAAGGHFDEIVAFHPHQIKSAFNQSPTDDPRLTRANGGKVDLYSKAARIIRGLKDQPMPVDDIIKYALGKGVKKAEIEHSDIPSGRARPSQVAEHIEFMQPQIGVERKGDLVNEFNRLMNGDMMSYTSDDFRRMDELDRMISEGGHLTQYPQYQLPGSKNYREHILTLENHPDDQTFMAKRHWGDLKNPLAHIRMSDRETPDGKKILHIEEMQSDWNNAARNMGFRTGREQQDYDDFVADMRRQMIDRVNARTGQDYYDPMTGEVAPTMSPMVAKAQIEKYQQMDPYMLALKLGVQERHSALARAANPNVMAPPKAPYINPKRDDWAELAMKHVLTEAAKGGYDGITFTPDAAQSQRWGGTNFEGIYDKKLPSLAHRLVQQHDPSVQPDQVGLPATTTPSALIPLTDTARDSIMKNGFSAFRRGGYVTHVRRGR